MEDMKAKKNLTMPHHHHHHLHSVCHEDLVLLVVFVQAVHDVVFFRLFTLVVQVVHDESLRTYAAESKAASKNLSR